MYFRFHVWTISSHACYMYIVLVHMHVHVDDPLPAALRSRAEELKTAVSQLVELLDLNQPSTARLKV